MLRRKRGRHCAPRTKTAFPIVDLSGFAPPPGAIRKAAATGAITLTAAAFLVTSAIPAQAVNFDAGTPPPAPHISSETQSITVTGFTAPVVVATDTYTVAAPAAVVVDEYIAAPAVPAEAPAPVVAAPAVSGSAILDYAAQFIGVVPYGMGNHPSDSFACDGLTQYVMAAFGVELPRGADAQGAMGTVISQSEAVAGDLIWWPGQHIGFYDGNGGMLDSPDWGRYVQHRGDIWGNPVFVRL